MQIRNKRYAVSLRSKSIGGGCRTVSVWKNYGGKLKYKSLGRYYGNVARNGINRIRHCTKNENSERKCH